jgi:hypothetical protein
MNNFPRYLKKEIKATKNAANELWRFKKDLWDILEILENGYDCSRSKRKINVLEKCVRKGNNIFKAVVVDLNDYLLLIHFGKFTYKKR